jgi:hypothetical protein
MHGWVSVWTLRKIWGPSHATRLGYTPAEFLVHRSRGCLHLQFSKGSTPSIAYRLVPPHYSRTYDLHLILHTREVTLTFFQFRGNGPHVRLYLTSYVPWPSLIKYEDLLIINLFSCQHLSKPNLKGPGHWKEVISDIGDEGYLNFPHEGWAISLEEWQL